MRRKVSLLALATLAGCTSVNNSVVLNSDLNQPQGLAYSLPTRPVEIDLVYDPGRGFALSVTLLPAVAERDTIHLLGYSGSPFDKDTVQWTTVNGLLTDVNVASVSRLLDTVQGAGESVGAIVGMLQTAASSNQTMVAQLNFDPASASSTSSAANRLTSAMHDFARRELARSAMTPQLKKTDLAGRAAKKLREAILGEAQAATINIESDLVPVAGANAPVSADCTVGVCYRPLRYGQVTISIGAVVFAQLGMTVPNGARPVAFPIRRSGAADSSTVLTLDHGVLTGATITKEAEAPNIVRIPGTLIGGVIKGLTDTITARKGSVSARTDYVTAATAKVNADAALVAAQVAAKAAAATKPGYQSSVDKNPYLGWLPAGLSTASVAQEKQGAPVPDAKIVPGGKVTPPAAAGTPGGAGNPNPPGGATQSPPGTTPPEPGAATETPAKTEQ